MSEHEAPDPLIDEIYEIRKQISREHGDDLDRLFKHYAEYEGQFKGRLISRTMTPNEELALRKGLEELRHCDPDDLDSLADEVHEPVRSTHCRSASPDGGGS